MVPTYSGVYSVRVLVALHVAVGGTELGFRGLRGLAPVPCTRIFAFAFAFYLCFSFFLTPSARLGSLAGSGRASAKNPPKSKGAGRAGLAADHNYKLVLIGDHLAVGDWPDRP